MIPIVCNIKIHVLAGVRILSVRHKLFQLGSIPGPGSNTVYAAYAVELSTGSISGEWTGNGTAPKLAAGSDNISVIYDSQ